MQRRFYAVFAALALASATIPAAAVALTIDWEGFAHGDIVARPTQTTPDYTLTVENLNRSFDIGVAFDTNASGTADEDLEIGSGWSGGNLAPDTQLGNVLILQERNNCGSTSCSDPDDEGDRPAGSFRFALEASYEQLSFDLVDVEDEISEMGSIRFLLGAAVVKTFDFADFLNFGQGVAFGDNTANRIVLGPAGLASIGSSFDGFVIELGGSGGVDNLVLTPEPATSAMLGMGLTALAISGRRRRRRR